MADFDLNYEIGMRSGKVKGKLAIVQDSLFFVNMVSPLGNEIARVILDRQDFLFINRLERNYLDTTVSYFNSYINNVDLLTLMELMFAGIFQQDEWKIRKNKGEEGCEKFFLVGNNKNNEAIVIINDCENGHIDMEITHEDFISNVNFGNNPGYGFYLPEDIALRFNKQDVRLFFKINKYRVNEVIKIKKSVPSRYDQVDFILEGDH
jgi:hypothetical protein